MGNICKLLFVCLCVGGCAYVCFCLCVFLLCVCLCVYAETSHILVCHSPPVHLSGRSRGKGKERNWGEGGGRQTGLDSELTQGLHFLG